MGSGLDFDLGHDGVAFDPGHESREPIAGRNGVGVVAGFVSEFDGEPGQFRSFDFALAAFGSHGGDPSLIGPPSNGVHAYAKELRCFSEPKLVHARKTIQKHWICAL